MILQVMILLLGFVLLVKGADWFVEGAASIARKLGIPQLIVGLTIRYYDTTVHVETGEDGAAAFKLEFGGKK